MTDKIVKIESFKTMDGEVFEKEANKSQLVQSLLRIHYKSKGVNVRTYVRVLK